MKISASLFANSANLQELRLVVDITLALGIGVNTAIFSVVEGTLLRPLPFLHPERLVRIYEAQDENGARGASLNLSDRTVVRFRESGRNIFEDIAGGTGGTAVVGSDKGSPAQSCPPLRSLRIFFRCLVSRRDLVAPLGRRKGEWRCRCSYHQRRFLAQRTAARNAVLGSSLLIDETLVRSLAYAKSFRHPYRASIWLPPASIWTIPRQSTTIICMVSVVCEAE